MRCSATLGRNGPTSFSTSRRIGLASIAATPIPISPPIEVPTQSTSSSPSRLEQLDHVADVGRQGVVLGVGQRIAQAAAGDVGTDHPPVPGQDPRQMVEVAPVAGQAMDADHRARSARARPSRRSSGHSAGRGPRRGRGGSPSRLLDGWRGGRSQRWCPVSHEPAQRQPQTPARSRRERSGRDPLDAGRRSPLTRAMPGPRPLAPACRQRRAERC